MLYESDSVIESDLNPYFEDLDSKPEDLDSGPMDSYLLASTTVQYD